jgi:transcriptional regulator with GAF, ATPase, and Fis domain
MVADGRFRADLFYRLSIFPIPLPRLRDRREDVPLLIRYFMDGCAQRMNKRIDIIPPAAMDAMQRYFWPGNIRELQNFIARAVILTSGATLEAPLWELRQVTDTTVSELLSRMPSALTSFAFLRRPMDDSHQPPSSWAYRERPCSTRSAGSAST